MNEPEVAALDENFPTPWKSIVHDILEAALDGFMTVLAGNWRLIPKQDASTLRSGQVREIYIPTSNTASWVWFLCGSRIKRGGLSARRGRVNATLL